MKIFVSYSRSDLLIAEDIATKLTFSGHKVFFDRHSLPKGEEFDARIQKEVNQAHLFLYLISPASVSTGAYARTELGYAKKRWPKPGARVLPVMVLPTPINEVPAYLRSINFVRAEGNVATEVQDAVRGLSRRKQVKSIAVVASLLLAAALGATGWEINRRTTKGAYAQLDAKSDTIKESKAVARSEEYFDKVGDETALLDQTRDLTLPEIEELRKDLANRLSPSRNSNSESWADVIRRFQSSSGLKPDGVIGKDTLQALRKAPALGLEDGGRGTVKAVEEEIFKTLNEESIGKFRHRQKDADLVKFYGEPESKGRTELWEAIGEWVEDWNYPTLGVVVKMSSEKQEAPKLVLMVIAGKGCELTTARGIKVGSTRAEVQKAYGDVEEKVPGEGPHKQGDPKPEPKEKDGKEEDTLVAGTIYGGVIFTFKDSKVSEILLGATAE